MPRLADMTAVTDEMLESAVRWYQDQAACPPACFQGVHPLVLHTAAELCDCDWRRVVVDGPALVVYNRPVW